MTKYRTIGFLVILYFIIINSVPFLLPHGGIGGDFPLYIKIAKDLPEINNNLFPIGFPFFLRIFETLTSEYFYSSLLLKSTCFIFIIFFSYKKKFYFIETVFVMMIKSSIWVFIHQGSEYITLPFLYLYIYVLHQYFNGALKPNKFLIYSTILGFILCTIRYANVFIFISILPFIIYYWKKFNTYRKTLFTSTVLIGISFFLYLLYNYVIIGSLAGENNRVNDELDTFWFDTYVDFIGIINLSNPFFYLKTFEYSSTIKLMISLLFIFVDLILWRYCWKVIKNKQNVFVTFLLFIAIVNALFTFFAAMFQGIEPLGIRLLFSSSYLFWFALVILIRENKLLSDKLLVTFCLFSLIFNVLIIVKNPINFIAYKNNIEEFIDHKKIKPLYYFDDDKKVEETTYKIPFTSKKFDYIHPNRQPDFIYQAILNSINPSIIYLKEKPEGIHDKNIIYSSQLNEYIEHKKSH